MSLRLLEVIVPDQPLEGVLVLLQDVDVVHVWTAGPPEAPGLVRIRSTPTRPSSYRTASCAATVR